MLTYQSNDSALIKLAIPAATGCFKDAKRMCFCNGFILIKVG